MLKTFMFLTLAAVLSLSLDSAPAEAGKKGCRGMIHVDGKSSRLTIVAKRNARKAWRAKVKRRYGSRRSTRWSKSRCRHYHCRFVGSSSKRKICTAWARPRKT